MRLPRNAATPRTKAADLAALLESLGPGAKRPPARAVTNSEGMNKGESAYANHLELLKRAGEIVYYRYAPINLKLAPDCFYRPDFLVHWANGELEIVDVKGRKGEFCHIEEDSWIKIKIVAHMFPFRMVVVWPLKGNAGWGRRVIGSPEELPPTPGAPHDERR
jgi:hypothetical protein